MHDQEYRMMLDFDTSSTSAEVADPASDTVQRLAEDWRGAGIGDGDTVLVHSSLKRTMRRLLKQKLRVDPADVVESFRQATGPTGTVLFPLFNWDFPKGIPFDVRTSPSQMGSLTEAARLYPGAMRTGHPIYSFAVIGAQAELFRGMMNFSGYGDDSCFAKLREMGGKIAVLDLPDQNSMTFYHHVEEMHDAPYRYHKTFRGEYTDWSGNTEEREFGLFVRNIEQGVRTHVDPMGEILWSDGCYRGNRPGEGSGLRVIEASAMYDAVAHVITSGQAEGLLYRIEA